MSVSTCWIAAFNPSRLVLRKLRDKTGLSAAEVAEQVGMSSSKISRIETVDTGFYIDDLECLLDFYRVSNAYRIEESVLTRPIGDAGALSRQLRHLADMAGKANVTIRVLPTVAGLHPGLNGPFVILGYEEEPSLVLLEHKMVNLFLDETEQLDGYSEAWASLDKLVLEADAASAATAPRVLTASKSPAPCGALRCAIRRLPRRGICWCPSTHSMRCSRPHTPPAETAGAPRG